MDRFFFSQPLPRKLEFEVFLICGYYRGVSLLISKGRVIGISGPEKILDEIKEAMMAKKKRKPKPYPTD